MKMMKLFIILFLCLSTNAKELLNDPYFKKFKENWKLNKKSEYNYIKKPDIKNGVLSLETKHTSEHHYLILQTDLDLDAGKTYELRFSMKIKGEGEVFVSYYGKDGKIIEPLGLRQKITANKGWKDYTCVFNAAEMNKTKIQFLSFIIGCYKGEFSIKNLALRESAEDLSLAKFGQITDSE